MVATIVLNQSNLVADGNNNTLVYKFPNSVSFPNHEIAVQSVNMFYSWTNINVSPLNNNKFSYTWVVGTTTTTYQVVIPAGLYEITDLNAYLQYVFIQNGTYLFNGTQNVYYAEFIVNSSRYAVQLNTFPVPTSLPAGWTAPVANPAAGTAGWVGYATQTFNPSISLPANFNKIVGFTAGFQSSQNTNVGTNLSYLSTTAPQVQPNSNLLFSVSNIGNPYAIPSSIIFSVAPSVAFGEQVIETPPQFSWNKLLSGTYNELRLTLLGTDLQPLQILDPNMTILLCIRDMKTDLNFIEKLSGGKG